MWKAQILEKILANAIFYILPAIKYCKILTIAANISSCPRTTLPPSPSAFSISQYFACCDLPPVLFKTNLSYLTKKNTTVIWFGAWTVEIR